MEQYQSVVEAVLRNGTYKENRTAVDTISDFSQHYSVDLQKGFPLLTTKKMDGFRWNSLVEELLWFFSGEEHIRNLREKTSIWDEWADEDGELETAYGRFWRRYPIPKYEDWVPGEAWPDPHMGSHDHVTNEQPGSDMDDRFTFDQLGHVIDELKTNPHSRRLVVNAWHPANAAVSTLPPCHYTFVFNVQGEYLNCHLTQRSGDLGLGVPFNLASYSLLTHIVAQETGFKPGKFSHTIVDAHVYCGKGDRGSWYGNSLDELQQEILDVQRFELQSLDGLADVVEETAPDEATGEVGHDHVPGLLRQLSREPLQRPEIEIADKPIDELTADDIELSDYEHYDPINLEVAE